MRDEDLLAEQFEGNRDHLRGVAYRMLGSLSEADDAVQEAWLRLSRSDTSAIDNLTGWLTTVTARVCLDMLRSRASRREDQLPTSTPDQGSDGAHAVNPEDEAVLADSVGLALLVVLETLPPAERLAFVLHDMFAVPFDEIAPIVGRSTTAARQLASRGRRRVRGAGTAAAVDVARRREVVEAFLAASRGGDFDGLVALLDPGVVLHVDRIAAGGDVAREVRGADAVAGQAHAHASGAEFARTVLIDGAPGIIRAPRGHLLLAQLFEIEAGRITDIEIVADPDRLGRLELSVLPD